MVEVIFPANSEESYTYHNCTFFRQSWKFSQKLWNMITQNKDTTQKIGPITQPLEKAIF